MSQPAVVDGAWETCVDSDDELAALAIEDPAAFAALYERYLPPVYRYLRTRVRSREEAADLAHLVFVRAMNALPAYRAGRAPFAAWLFRIARNAATDAYRRRRPTVSWDELPEPLSERIGDHPEAAVLRRERLLRLRALVAQLDAGKQELLALRFAGGLSTREIALVAGKSQAAVKKQLTRILASMKEHYHDDR